VITDYAETDATGIAQAQWVLGTLVDQLQELEALIAAGIGGALSVEFTATVMPAAASQLVRLAGDNQTGSLGEVLPDSLAVQVADQYGNGVSAVEIAWSVSGASGGSIAARAAVSDTSGTAKAAWRLGARLDAPHMVTAVAPGLPALTFNATATIPTTARLHMMSGDAQRAPVGSALAESLAVRLTLADGQPIQGGTLEWAVTAGGGTIEPVQSTTDATGVAKARWVLGTAMGAGIAAVTVAGLPTVSFTAHASADVPAEITKAHGDNQHGIPGQFALDSLAVVVRDRHGNPVPDASVTFTVTAGDGSPTPSTVQTNADGRASTRFRLGVAGSENSVAPNVGSISGEPFRIFGTPGPDWSLTFWQTSDGWRVPFEPSWVRVRLSDGAGRGLRGATVAWSASDTGRMLAATTVTDSVGIASNYWRLSCNLPRQTLTASLAGVAPATVTGTPRDMIPWYFTNVTGWPQTAAPYSTHSVDLTMVGVHSCPVPNTQPPVRPYAAPGEPPTGLTMTVDPATDSLGRFHMTVSFGGYIGSQCLWVGVPPYDGPMCAQVVASAFSRLEIVPDPIVISGPGVMTSARAIAYAADGSPAAVWGARWRLLDSEVIAWITNENTNSVSIMGSRPGTSRFVAMLGDRADTVLVHVGFGASLGTAGAEARPDLRADPAVRRAADPDPGLLRPPRRD
jgi:adhesin/invasin